MSGGATSLRRASFATTVAPFGHLQKAFNTGELGFRGCCGTVSDETETIDAWHRAEHAKPVPRDAVDSVSEGFVIDDRPR